MLWTVLLVLVIQLVSWIPTASSTNKYGNAARYAMKRLMNWYLPGRGLWIGHLSYPPDWCRANVVESLANYYLFQADQTEKDYLWTVMSDVRKFQGSTFYQTAEYFDDVLWWSLAYQRWYEIAHTDRADEDAASYFLMNAMNIVNVVYEDSWGRDTLCGGGCYWSRTSDYKNAITNELFIAATSKLARLFQERQDLEKSNLYRNYANEAMNWFVKSGMIQTQNPDNQSKLIVDGLNSTCQPTGAVYTYNQGVILGGIEQTVLYAMENNMPIDKSLLQLSEQLIHSVGELMTNDKHILTESSCGDGALFKGIYSRYLNYFSSTIQYGGIYSVNFLLNQMSSVWAIARDGEKGYFGRAWDQNYDGDANHNVQTSVIELFNTNRNEKASWSQCNNHGLFVHNSCACDPRYSGETCEQETPFGSIFSNANLTFSTFSDSAASLLCQSKTSPYFVTLCISDEDLDWASFQVESDNPEKNEVRLRGKGGLYISNTEMDDEGRVLLVPAGSDMSNLSFKVLIQNQVEMSNNPFKLESIILQSTVDSALFLTVSKIKTVTLQSVGSSSSSSSSPSQFLYNVIQTCHQ